MISEKIRIEDYIEDSSDEETTLEQDLLKDSESIYHREIRTIQIEIHKKRITYYRAIETWANEQIVVGNSFIEQCIKQQADENLRNFEDNIRWEMDQYREKFTYEKELRDINIRLFSLDYERSAKS